MEYMIMMSDDFMTIETLENILTNIIEANKLYVPDECGENLTKFMIHITGSNIKLKTLRFSLQGKNRFEFAVTAYSYFELFNKTLTVLKAYIK